MLRGKAGQWERFDAEGLILGIMKKVNFEEKSLQLEARDLLLFYTDGITEAENPEGDFSARNGCASF